MFFLSVMRTFEKVGINQLDFPCCQFFLLGRKYLLVRICAKFDFRIVYVAGQEYYGEILVSACLAVTSTNKQFVRWSPKSRQFQRSSELDDVRKTKWIENKVDRQQSRSTAKTLLACQRWACNSLRYWKSSILWRKYYEITKANKFCINYTLLRCWVGSSRRQ